MNKFFDKPWEQWIGEYSQSHQHPVNQACHKFGIPMILISLPFLAGGIWSQPLLRWGVLLFVLGWLLQFIGHAYERKWPEFFKDWRFLFVGVRWWWKHLTERH